MGSPGFNSHGALVWLAVPLGSALFRAVGRGWQTVILRDPSSSYRFGKSFFQSLDWKCPSCCEKGLRGEKNLHSVMFWEYTPPLAPPKCVVWAKIAAVLGWNLRVGALAFEPAAFMGSKRQGLRWLGGNSGQETETWLQKAAVSWLCQAVGVLEEDRSELERHRFCGAGFARLPCMQELFAGVPAWLPPSWPGAEPVALGRSSAI